MRVIDHHRVTNNVRPYKRATLVRSFTGTVDVASAKRTGLPEGATARAELWESHASDGFHTDYQQRQVRWVTSIVTLPDDCRVVEYGRQYRTVLNVGSRFAGRRYDDALTEFEQTVRAFRSSGITGSVEEAKG